MPAIFILCETDKAMDVPVFPYIVQACGISRACYPKGCRSMNGVNVRKLANGVGMRKERRFRGEENRGTFCSKVEQITLNLNRSV